MAESTHANFELQIHSRVFNMGEHSVWKNPACDEWEEEAMQTYVKTKNKVVDPTRSVAAVDTGMYLVGLNLFPALLGIL